MPWPYKQRGEERLSSTFFDWAKDNLQKNASNPDAFIAEVPSLEMWVLYVSVSLDSWLGGYTSGGGIHKGRPQWEGEGVAQKQA